MIVGACVSAKLGNLRWRLRHLGQEWGNLDLASLISLADAWLLSPTDLLLGSSWEGQGISRKAANPADPAKRNGSNGAHNKPVQTPFWKQSVTPGSFWGHELERPTSSEATSETKPVVLLYLLEQK